MQFTSEQRLDDGVLARSAQSHSLGSGYLAQRAWPALLIERQAVGPVGVGILTAPELGTYENEMPVGRGGRGTCQGKVPMPRQPGGSGEP